MRWSSTASGPPRPSATWSTTPCATAAAASAWRADGQAELHVQDEGPGFPEGFVDHAFDRFSRADPARQGPGAGLGLAIVGVIANAHGGSAHAANRDGGADVWLELPADTAT